jgi:hypothetical protein
LRRKEALALGVLKAYEEEDVKMEKVSNPYLSPRKACEKYVAHDRVTHSEIFPGYFSKREYYAQLHVETIPTYLPDTKEKSIVKFSFSVYDHHMYGDETVYFLQHKYIHSDELFFNKGNPVKVLQKVIRLDLDIQDSKRAGFNAFRAALWLKKNRPVPLQAGDVTLPTPLIARIWQNALSFFQKYE